MPGAEDRGILEMQHRRDSDISIAGLEVWVHGYQYSEAVHIPEASWLRVTARCRAKGASVRVTGAILDVRDVIRLGAESGRLYQNEINEFEVNSLESEVRIALKTTDALGHVELSVKISPDYLSQWHKFLFDIDRSYLPSLASQCRRLSERFPYRNG